MAQHAKPRYGNIEVARVLDLPFYDKDPLRVATRYIDGALRRIHQAERFGAKNEIANTLAERLGERYGEGATNIAKTFIDRITGRESFSGANEALSGKLAKSFEASKALLS